MMQKGTFYIKTFGCAQNTADSERLRTYFRMKGFGEVGNWKAAEVVVINSCVVRESAENRVYGLIENIKKYNKKIKVIVTGCLVPIAKKREVKGVDEWLPIAEVGFEWEPVRDRKTAALVNISSGCNNFCSYCIVPYSRGKELSRTMEEVLAEIDKAVEQGFTEVVLIGQNVNSYGADFNPSKSPPPQADSRFDKGDLGVVHMGKRRLRSMFPVLLAKVAQRPLKKISFVSSNPWDFSDELIEVIAKYPNIDRLLHLPFQSGDDEILRKMNRGYTRKQYLELVEKIKKKVRGVRFSTDIIIGFPGEDEKAFENTVDVCKQVNFEIAYLNKYSPRPGTMSAKLYENDVPMAEKKRRWEVLNELVNKKTSQ